jgi:hypothetical protein
MKQRFLLSLLFVCSLVVSTRAQINKGAIWLGGQAGYSQSTNKTGSITTGKVTSFNFSPAVGTAVKENLIVGVFVNYSTYKNKSNITTIKKEETIGGGLFIRKYIPVVNRVYLFGDARAFFNSYKSTDNYGSPEDKVKGWDAGISATPGVSFAITNKIQIETGLNTLFSTRYQKRNHKAGFTETDESSFNTGLFLDNSSQVFIGLRFLINKKA